MARSVRSLGVVLCGVLFAACSDAGPTGHSPVPARSEFARLSPAFGSDEQLVPLAGFPPLSDVLALLGPGQCLVERLTPGGTVTRVRRTIVAFADQASSESFSVGLRGRSGAVGYRGTCFLARGGWAEALELISLDPRRQNTPGEGWPVEFVPPEPDQFRGLGSNHESPSATNNLGSALGQSDSAFGGRELNTIDWSLYSHYDFCFYWADYYGNPVSIIHCGYYDQEAGCEPTFALSAGEASVTEECEDLGSGGASGGGNSDFGPGDPTPPEVEVLPDTVVMTPTCPVSSAAPSYDRAWCAGTPVTGGFADDIQEAINGMNSIGGPCGVLAAKAQSLLNLGRIRVFSRDAVNTGGAGFGDGIALLDRWFAYHESPFERDGKKINLQFVLAHEIDEGFGRPHTLVVNGWYAETVNSLPCSGLSSG